MPVAAQDGRPPIPVAVAEAAVTQWQPQRTAVGSLSATQEITVSPEVPGRVTRIAFASGEAVVAGDVLVQLDDAADRAQLAELQAQRKLAGLELDRIGRLVRERSLSEADLDVASSTLDQLEARIAAQRDRIEKKTLRAPFAGRLGLRKVSVGQVLAVGDEVVSLQSYQPLYVDFPVPQNALAEVAVGQPITLRTDAYPERAFPAIVAALDARVDPRSRIMVVRGETANEDEALRPGMFVTVELALGDPKPYVTLPASALIYSTFGTNVFIVEGENDKTVVRRIAVQPGERRGDLTAVLSGLSPGDRVVASGQTRLRDGAAVRVDPEAPVFSSAELRDITD